MLKINWLELKHSLYVLLLPIFFLSHGYNENFGLIPSSAVLNLGIKYLAITVSVWLLSYFLFRNLKKAALFAFLVLSIFFFFGAFHDFLKNHTESFFKSYSFLLPCISILIITAFFIIKRFKFISPKKIIFLNFLFFFLVLWELGTFVLYHFSNKSNTNNLAADQIKLRADSTFHKPDIFFVVLDGYTSSSCLKEQFQYDNSEIDSLLKQHGFYTSYASKSNYNMTPFSLSSTLNANYLSEKVEKTLVSNKVFSQAIGTFYDNHLMKFFEQKGYVIKNYGCFDYRNARTANKPYFDYWDKNLIDNQTLYARIRRDIGWNFIVNENAPPINFLVDEYKQKKAYHIFRNTSNWNYLLDEIQKHNTSPRFVYAHIMLPHEPFFIDSEGKTIPDSILLKNVISPTQGYINQLIYTNSLLKEFITLCSNKSAKPRIVIIEGDHGYRFYANNKANNDVFRNLNTYYFSDKDYSMLYDGISPVNSFRVVLNKYFRQHLPILKDSSIYLEEPAVNY